MFHVVAEPSNTREARVSAVRVFSHLRLAAFCVFWTAGAFGAATGVGMPPSAYPSLMPYNSGYSLVMPAVYPWGAMLPHMRQWPAAANTGPSMFEAVAVAPPAGISTWQAPAGVLATPLPPTALAPPTSMWMVASPSSSGGGAAQQPVASASPPDHGAETQRSGTGTRTEHFDTSTRPPLPHHAVPAVPHALPAAASRSSKGERAGEGSRKRAPVQAASNAPVSKRVAPSERSGQPPPGVEFDLHASSTDHDASDGVASPRSPSKYPADGENACAGGVAGAAHGGGGCNVGGNDPASRDGACGTWPTPVQCRGGGGSAGTPLAGPPVHTARLAYHILCDARPARPRHKRIATADGGTVALYQCHYCDYVGDSGTAKDCPRVGGAGVGGNSAGAKRREGDRPPQLSPFRSYGQRVGGVVVPFSRRTRDRGFSCGGLLVKCPPPRGLQQTCRVTSVSTLALGPLAVPILGVPTLRLEATTSSSTFGTVARYSAAKACGRCDLRT